MVSAGDSLDALLGRVYDAAAGFCSWHEVLEELARSFGSAAAVLGIVGPRSPGRIVHTGIDPPLVTRYLERHAGRNELALRTASLPAGAVVTDGGLMPKAEFVRTAFYGDCLRPLGLHSLMNLRAARSENGVVANLCVFRSARSGEFGTEEVARLQRIAPHLCRAVAVHLRVSEAEGERRALAEALERLPRAAFLVDGAVVVQRANAAGTALLAAKDGLYVERGEGGALRAGRPEETLALRRLVADTVARHGWSGAGAAHLCVSRSPPKPPLVVSAVPLGAAGAAEVGLPPIITALLLVTDPELRPDPPPPSLLRDTFGLTRAEAEVAVRAAQGEGMPAVASSLGITQGTARLHLHRVFEKTGAHRQAELATILARLKP